jgi:hypothetical protein
MKKFKHSFTLPPMSKFDFSDKTNQILIALGAVFIVAAAYAYNAYGSYKDWMFIAEQDIVNYYDDENYLEYVEGDLAIASDYKSDANTGGFVAVASAVAAAVVYKKRKA